MFNKWCIKDHQNVIVLNKELVGLGESLVTSEALDILPDYSVIKQKNHDVLEEHEMQPSEFKEIVVHDASNLRLKVASILLIGVIL